MMSLWLWRQFTSRQSWIRWARCTGAYIGIIGTTCKARFHQVDSGGSIWPVEILSKKQPLFQVSFAILFDERFFDGDYRQLNDICWLPILQSRQKRTIHRQKSHNSAWLVMSMLVLQAERIRAIWHWGDSGQRERYIHNSWNGG